MIKLVRLDYRLVHGQVLAAWVNQISAQRIIVVDDAAANDEMRSAALKLANLRGSGSISLQRKNHCKDA